MMDKIFPGHWVPLSFEVRQYLVKEFKIPQSSYTQVDNNKLVTDGRTPGDLEAFSAESMKAFLKIKGEHTFAQLWEKTIEKAIHATTPIIASSPVEKPVDTVDNTIKAQETLTVATGKTLEVANIALGLTANKDENAKGNTEEESK